MSFTDEQKLRYARHFNLDGVGEDGQKKLLNARVLVIGAGGLGSPVIMYLTSAGVGTIGIADADVVDGTNLQRQVIHNTNNIGKSKVISAKEFVEALNPDVKINPYCTLVDESNISDIIKDYDIVVDATDNFDSKFLINDTCVKLKKPFVHAGVIEFHGQLMTYVPGKSPCYRCVFENPPEKNTVPTCKEVGVMGACCGIIGCLEAMEVIKLIIGTGDLLTGYLLTYDALKSEFRKIKLPSHNPNCSVCNKN